MENSCRSLGLLMKVQATTFTRFMLLVVAGPRNFLALQRTRTIGQTARASHFGRIRATKLIVWRGWCVKQAARRLKGPEVCVDYSPGYYAFFFEDPDGNKLEICCRESPVIAG